jgi:uncharacterized membrane protein (DUF373 family)
VAAQESGAELRLSDIARIGEVVLYCLIALVLFLGALTLVGRSLYDLADGLAQEGAIEAARATLDTLLLTFIFVELLGATRVIIREQRLVAEPFLLVGIIAAIKELVVLTGAEELSGHGWDAFRNGMIEIGVVVGVVLVLTVCTLLLRRSQRDPSEVDEK